MTIDAIDTEIRSFRLEYGIDTELVDSDSETRIAYFNHNESSVEGSAHGDQI